MNTIEITNALKNNKVTKNIFTGVFACNQLPRGNFKKPSLNIANTQPSWMTGLHWIALYIPKSGKIEYFDSFASGKTKNRYFTKFIKKNSNYAKCIINTHKLQGDFSSVCGYYCCMYAYWRCKGKSLSNFINMFSKSDVNRNDFKVKQMFIKHFKKSKRSLNQQGGFSNSIHRQCLNQKCKPRKRK